MKLFCRLKPKHPSQLKKHKKVFKKLKLKTKLRQEHKTLRRVARLVPLKNRTRHRMFSLLQRNKVKFFHWARMQAIVPFEKWKIWKDNRREKWARQRAKEAYEWYMLLMKVYWLSCCVRLLIALAAKRIATAQGITVIALAKLVTIATTCLIVTAGAEYAYSGGLLLSLFVGLCCGLFAALPWVDDEPSSFLKAAVIGALTGVFLIAWVAWLTMMYK